MDDLSSYLSYLLAFLFVLALIGIVAWLFKSLTGGRNANSGGRLFGGREKRIGVVQAASVDGRRKLILVRRDDKEHLIMVGGPVDMLIENGIEPPDAQTLGSPRHDSGASAERRGAREPLVASAELNEPEIASADIGTTAETEPDQDAANQDVPKRRISLTMRRDQSRDGDEP